ncbi:CbtA family protein [Pseudonocardia petroleophila]|uniref:CbtA family protein n=1 Tax=Pseudonocardia petroleophila TaxID=37331 RepID=A0A7G7MGY6_9PSEU|nr:CbtA family protein [Pseudonocardia petroleophila]QNG52047.1 CbtA family protein [Pseudonocardia petroleophila]
MTVGTSSASPATDGGTAIMVRALLVRGMAAGVVAGLAYFVFAYLFGEAAVDGAIAYEDSLTAAAHGASGEPPLVSRGIQSTVGLGIAAVLYGVVIGGLLALVYAAVVGRVGRLSPRATAAVIAVVGFVAVAAVPFLKYPANPPASTVDSTVGQRTGPFVALIIISVALMIGTVLLQRSLTARLGTWNATLTATGAYVAAAGIVGFLLPTVDETPADFPATVLYDFRLASIGGQVVLWAVVGLVFGALVDDTSKRRSGTRLGLADR